MARKLSTTDGIEKMGATELQENGIRYKRLFPNNYKRHFDPFVLLDEFHMDIQSEINDQTNEGFECVTYMLDGSLKHTDGLENNEELASGDAQRFTAGNGYRHSEKPVQKLNHGIRLWIDLPEENKDDPASYQIQHADDLPVNETDARFVRSILSEKSPLKVKASVLFQDYSIAADTEQKIEIPEQHRAILYLPGDINGTLHAEDTLLESGDALLIDLGADNFKVKSKNEAVRFMLITGKPLNQEIELKNNRVL
ncbi:pirin family protein [Psychroflexus sediminis]|uniref:Pirin N-terminal domain-containing protein n=1 Tax=Psychroflexus sediminis TaxID=470826 RepID=A0A1G7TVF9_9FLAO|nr:pirin family protein [Psychroflexus sediminis]SDG39317.1 hypothetical protein SAMN04488027_10185 [Psychroflexus sediminis]